MSEYIEDVCGKYKHLPIIIASESMADLWGWTSVVGKVYYIGAKSYENEDLACLAETGYKGESFIRPEGNLRYMSNIETICSLIEFDCSHWGLSALCYALRYLYSDVEWLPEVRKRNLEQKLEEKLNLAVELNEDDDSIVTILHAWQREYTNS